MRVTLTRTTVTAALAAFLLAGCASGEGTTIEPQQGTNRPAEEAPASDPAAAEDEQPPAEEPAAEEPVEPEPAANPKFGEAYTWSNGVQVTIGAPEPYQLKEFDFGGESAPAHVSFPVTLVNGSATNLDPSSFYTSMQSANVEAEEIYGDGLGSPQTAILPGREASFRIAYGVTDPADLVMEVTPSLFEYESAIWTS